MRFLTSVYDYWKHGFSEIYINYGICSKTEELKDYLHVIAVIAILSATLVGLALAVAQFPYGVFTVFVGYFAGLMPLLAGYLSQRGRH